MDFHGKDLIWSKIKYIKLKGWKYKILLRWEYHSSYLSTINWCVDYLLTYYGILCGSYIILMGDYGILLEAYGILLSFFGAFWLINVIRGEGSYT